MVPVTVTVTVTFRGTTSFATALADGDEPGKIRNGVTATVCNAALVKSGYTYEDDVVPLIVTVILPPDTALTFTTITIDRALYVVSATLLCVVVVPAAITTPVVLFCVLSQYEPL